MESTFGSWRNRDGDVPQESEIEFEMKLAGIEYLAERIRTYRTLCSLQEKLTDRWETKCFEQELSELRKEIEASM